MPSPFSGPGRQFAVFSFDSSELIITSFGGLVSVILGTIQGDSRREAAPIVAVIRVENRAAHAGSPRSSTR